MNLYTRKELSELLEIGHSTLVHHMIWDKKNCPQAIGKKGKTKLYEKQEIIDWYKHRQNLLLQQRTKNKTNKKPIETKEDILALWFFKARTKAKLTQKQVAEKLGVTPGAVSLWEQKDYKYRTVPTEEKLKEFFELTKENT